MSAASVFTDDTIGNPAATTLVAQLPQPAPKDAWLPRQLLAILGVGLILRLFVAFWLTGQPLYVWDERDYDMLATNLLRHGEFAFQSGQLTSLRPPFYPALLAGIYAVGGEQNYLAVRLLQVVVGVLTVWLVYCLGSRLYGQLTGTVAAAICAVYPSLLLSTGLLLTETLFTFLVVLACLLVQSYLTTGRLWWLVSFAAVLGLASLTRSVLWLLPPGLVLFLLLCSPAPTWRTRLLHSVIAVVVFALVIAPWAYRNTRLQRTFVAVDVMGGRNFMMGNYEHTPPNRPWDAISISDDHAWYALLTRRHPEAQQVTQGQLDKYALRYGLEYVAQHPLQTLQRDVAKFFHFWQLERELIAGLNRGF